MKPAHQSPFTPFSKILKDQQLGTETPSHFLEWDNYGETMFKGSPNDKSFGGEEFVKSAGRIQVYRMKKEYIQSTVPIDRFKLYACEIF